MKSDIKDINLAEDGKKRIDWAELDMPVLRSIRERFLKEKPLKGIKISSCLHVTTETANLIKTLKAGGAELFLVASNPLSTQDDVAASLVKHEGITVQAISGEDNDTYYSHLNNALDFSPNITQDDGADLVSTLHTTKTDKINNIYGSIEETTTGVIRLKSMEKANALKVPVIAANDSKTKHMFDNRYGTGQSVLDGITRATNRLFAGSTFTVCGYGWCGRGLAMKARGMGANVIVTEVDPVKSLEAVMDGFRVMRINDAVQYSNFVCTLTGDINVVDTDAFKVMKDGCIICNAGHFDVELNLKGLKVMSTQVTNKREFVTQYKLSDGRKIYVLADGRLVNLSAAEGHPAQVMDMSFSNQALAVEYILKNKDTLTNKVYTLPTEVDNNIAALKLAAMGIEHDSLTTEQTKYLNSWTQGT